MDLSWASRMHAGMNFKVRDVAVMCIKM